MTNYFLYDSMIGISLSVCSWSGVGKNRPRSRVTSIRHSLYSNEATSKPPRNFRSRDPSEEDVIGEKIGETHVTKILGNETIIANETRPWNWVGPVTNRQIYFVQYRDLGEVLAESSFCLGFESWAFRRDVVNSSETTLTCRKKERENCLRLSGH